MTQQRTSWVKWVAVGCGGVGFLVAVIVAVAFFTVMKATAEPERVVESLKEVQPLEEFIASVESNPSLFQIVDTAFTSRSRNLRGAEFEGTATLEAGSQIPVSFGLIQENDAWKLIAYNLGS